MPSVGLRPAEAEDRLWFIVQIRMGLSGYEPGHSASSLVQQRGSARGPGVAARVQQGPGSDRAEASGELDQINTLCVSTTT